MKTTTPQKPSHKILLADDEAAIAETITAYALKENIQIVHVQDGEQALEEFKKGKFDLLILD